MKTQLITFNGKKLSGKQGNITESPFSSPQSFDGFDINIISFDDETIWRYDELMIKSVNCINDIKNLGIMIRNSIKTNVVVVFPKDYSYRYCPNYQGNLTKRENLKNMLGVMTNILGKMLNPISEMDIVFEPTKTKIDNQIYSADFFFNEHNEAEVLLRSSDSRKAIVIRDSNIIYTTLELNSLERINEFLKNIGLNEKVEECPEWMTDVKLFDDNELLNKIKASKGIILEEESKIVIAENALSVNSHYKSILYTQSNELVEVVLEILEEMLGFDFSNFEDKHNEDFLYETEDVTYLGEIKGVTSNIRSEHVSQLDTHYYTYLDDHPDKAGKTKTWLIMNHQRKQSLSQRKEVHETQVKLAERNGSLIIDTYTLLKLFEKYKNGEFSSEDCLALLSNRTGIITVEDL